MAASAEPAPVRAAIVIVNYASHALVEQNFGPLVGIGANGDAAIVRGASESIVAASASVSVVVVDNFSSAREAELIAAVCARHGWDLVSKAGNTGFGRAMNVGVERAIAMGCEVFLLVNPDVSMTREVVDALVERAAAHPMTLSSPRVRRPDGSIWFDGGTVEVARGRTSTSRGADSSAENGWVSGACLVVDAPLWRAVGGFDPRYFLYWEDVDLSFRSVGAGGELAIHRDLEVVHAVGGTHRGTGKSPAYVYFNCRNRLIFARDHLAAHDVARWRATSLGYAREVVGRGGRRAFLRHAISLCFAALRGTIAGLAASRPAAPLTRG